MKYRVWIIKWYSEVDRTVCIGCAESVVAASAIIGDYQRSVPGYHYDVRVAVGDE